MFHLIPEASWVPLSIWLTLLGKWCNQSLFSWRIMASFATSNFRISPRDLSSKGGEPPLLFRYVLSGWLSLCTVTWVWLIAPFASDSTLWHYCKVNIQCDWWLLSHDHFRWIDDNVAMAVSSLEVNLLSHIIRRSGWMHEPNWLKGVN